jgi:hypothetical protein
LGLNSASRVFPDWVSDHPDVTPISNRSKTLPKKGGKSNGNLKVFLDLGGIEKKMLKALKSKQFCS